MEKIFEKLGVDFTSTKVIVDLGAWLGKSPCWFASKSPEAKVVAVEPMIENYIPMMSLIADYKVRNVIPVLSAISDKTGSALINFATKSESHSLLFKKRRMTGRTRLVPTMSWDYLVDLLDIQEVDLAKVNIEGAEIALLKGMTKVFPKKMLIEEHQRCLGNDYSYPELLSLIEQKGYKILDIVQTDLYLEKI